MDQTITTQIVYRKRTPVAALVLAEDMRAIEQATRLLESVDHFSISATNTQRQRDFAYDMLRSQITLLKTWQRYAQRKLRKEYLAR